MRILADKCSLVSSGITPIPEITNDLLSSTSRQLTNELPSSAALRMRFFRMRQKSMPKIPSTNDFSIPVPYSNTARNTRFLLANISNQSNRLILFASNEDLVSISRSDTVYGDGTFASCPRQFQQLYSLHSVENGKAFPRVYALLSSKSLEMYRLLFRTLKNVMVDDLALFFRPSYFVADFEAAVRRVVSEEVPGIIVFGCHFHYSQSLIRFVQQHSMIVTYRDNIVFRTAL